MDYPGEQFAEQYSEPVQRGAEALDRLCGTVGIIPCNWREIIDGKTLDLANGEKCVLGQAGADYSRETGSGGYPLDYWDVLSQLIEAEGIALPKETYAKELARTAWAVEHGFTIPADKSVSPANKQHWNALTHAWRKLLGI